MLAAIGLIDLVVLGLFVLGWTIASAKEAGWLSFWILVLFIIMSIGFNMPWVAFVTANPWILLPYAGMYLLMGVFWCLFKYMRIVRERVKKYHTDCAEWIQKNERKIAESSDGKLSEDDFYKQLNKFERDKYNFDLMREKERILTWLWWWPFSTIAFVLCDLFEWIWDLSFRVIRGLLENVKKIIQGDLYDKLN
jgi:hypothetical protein